MSREASLQWSTLAAARARRGDGIKSRDTSAPPCVPRTPRYPTLLASILYTLGLAITCNKFNFNFCDL